MKKFILGIMLLVLSMALVSCSSGTPEEKVAKYVETALADQEMQDLIEQNKAIGLDLQIVAEGTNLVYRSTFTIDLNDVGGSELVGTQLAADLDAPETVAGQQEAFDLVKKECPSVTGLLYEFYDKEGNLLASKVVE